MDVTLNNVALSGAVPTAVVTSTERGLLGARRDQFVDIPGRAGGWAFPEEPGRRTFAIDMTIKAASNAARRAACRAVAAWADVGAEARLVFSDESDRFYTALLSGFTGPVEKVNVAKLGVQFSVAPYAEAVATTTENLSATTNPDNDSFASSTEADAPVVIQLIPAGGGLTAFSFTLNGKTLEWAGTLASGSTITINTISETVTLGASIDVNLTGAFNPAQVDMADVSGEFGKVVPGTNTWALTWTGTATSVAMTLQYRERYY